MDKSPEYSLSLLLESIYKKYHIKSFIHPDPLEFLFRYERPEDREIAAIAAASLATGRVNLILKAVENVLEKIPSPSENLKTMTDKDIISLFEGFKYRFYDSVSITEFLISVRNIIREYGSLNNLFLYSLEKADNCFIQALSVFADRINSNSSASYRLLPDPLKGSACKRLNLFLRWMIRRDNIDPGGWEGISPSMLIVPLDTHMMQISTILGLVSRKSADMKSAVEITENFRKYDPDDPVRFDFSLTRLGIHPDLNYSELYNQFV